MMELLENVEVKNTEIPEKARDTIFDELRRDLGEWMTTERDMVWRPMVELTREDNEFAARALVPGVAAGEIEVLVAPDVLLIKGETHRGEPNHRKLLQSIRFPRPVDPGRVHAVIKDGMLSVRAEISEASKPDMHLLLRAA